MARHRNVRSMNYDEEYDGYDDVYGHSVEDDYSASPSVQQFIYDRNRSYSRSTYMDSDIPEEEEPYSLGKDEDQVDFKPQNEMEEVQMLSCLDFLKDRLGDKYDIQAAKRAVLNHKFDVEKALDALLQKNTTQPSLPTLPKAKAQIPPQTTGVSKVTRTSQPTASASPVTVVAQKKATTGFSLPGNNVKGGTVVDEVRQKVEKMEVSSLAPPQEREVPAVATPRSRAKENRLDAASEYSKERAGVKPLLNMVVVGHVDAGKSTLMGHLLYRLGQVSSKQMQKFEQESKKLGKQSFMYAWVLDETGEERSRGITMDVGQSQFETETKSITLLDAPGHRDFIPNMIFGTAQADVAILVVDSTTGEFETGFESGGQTREHALLVRSLGVSQLGVAVNKLDTTGWSKDRFDEICSKLGSFLRQAGFKEQDVFYVPVSGLTGENLAASPKETKLLEWYTGPTLLQAIDKFRIPDRPLNRPVRLVVSDVFRSTGVSSGYCLSGRLESGMIQTGDKLLLMPLNESILIKGVSVGEGSSGVCFAGDQVILTVSGPDSNSIAIGSVICDPSQPIKATTRVEARIVIFNVDIPIIKGCQVVLHYQSLSEAATITKLVAQIHKSTGEVVKKKPRCLTKHTSGLVEIEISRPVCMELYKDYRELGRFMLRSGGATIAAGLVTNLL